MLLNAHMDEVGLIVTGINENGLLRFSTVGGIDRRILPGKSVLVAGTVPGVIGAKPIHLLDGDEKEKAPALDSLTIDIGASSKEEAETLVSPGDSVTFVSLFDASHGRIRSRAIDDRAGCAILIDLMKKICPMTAPLFLQCRRKWDSGAVKPPLLPLSRKLPLWWSPPPLRTFPV